MYPRLALMAAPAVPITRAQRIEAGRQYLLREVLPYNPDLTWGELYTVMSMPKMGNIFSDIGSAIQTATRAGANAVGSAVGVGNLGSTITGFEDKVASSLRGTVGTQLQNDAQSSILDALGSFGQDIRTGHVVNAIFTPTGIIVIVAVLWFVFFRRH